MNKATNTKEVKRTKRRLPTKITHINTQVHTSTARSRVEHTHIQKPIHSMPKRNKTPKQNKNDRKRTTLKDKKEKQTQVRKAGGTEEWGKEQKGGTLDSTTSP
jgi:hypothetical protein